MPNEDKDKLEKVLEAYKPIPMKRMFYPRGFKLSDSFIDSFHQEYDRLVGEGLNPKSLMERLGKALRFHVNEKRRYKTPVVEGGAPGHMSKDDKAASIASRTVPPKEKVDPDTRKKKDKKPGTDSGITQS
jgi:hypothetical protein